MWVEQLSFSDLYPPLHQRLRLQLLSGKQLLTEHCLRLDHICRDMPPGECVRCVAHPQYSSKLKTSPAGRDGQVAGLRKYWY